MITVYSGPDCASCMMAKKFLKMKQVEFQEKSINEPGVMEEIRSLTGLMTVPVITNGKSVSQGFNAGRLIELIREDQDVR